MKLSQLPPGEHPGKAAPIELEFIKSTLSSKLPALRYLWLQCGRRLEMVHIQPKDGPEIVEEHKGTHTFVPSCGHAYKLICIF
jgi:hypothetical protein